MPYFAQKWSIFDELMNDSIVISLVGLQCILMTKFESNFSLKYRFYSQSPKCGEISTTPPT